MTHKGSLETVICNKSCPYLTNLSNDDNQSYRCEHGKISVQLGESCRYQLFNHMQQTRDLAISRSPLSQYPRPKFLISDH